MNYESSPLCTANPTPAKGGIAPILPEQMKYLQDSTNQLCDEVSKLLYFACGRGVELPMLEDTCLTSRLSWTHNAMMRFLEALSDVNRVVQ